MHFDLVFVGDALLNQEFADVASVIALELNNRAPDVVLHSSAVTAPHALELSDDFLQVQILWQSLHQCQALARRSLLEVQV